MHGPSVKETNYFIEHIVVRSVNTKFQHTLIEQSPCMYILRHIGHDTLADRINEYL